MITIIDLGFLGHLRTIASFLIATPKGPILIETGPHSTFPKLKQGIENAGYEVKDIQHVFLSHIHLDHAGAAWVFAEHGATIYLHPFGMRHLANPEKLLASAKMIYRDEMDRLWGRMEPIPAANLRAAGHNERFKFGKEIVLRSLHTPGHAVHHIAWELGDQLFAGDVAGVRIDEGIVVPPCPPPDINLQDWQSSLRMIKSKRYKKIFLTHFGEVNNVKPHLIELEGRLNNWANWIKPYWEKGDSIETITPLFQSYVQKQLTAGGISAEGLERYENANPSWMSVAGLLRYWRKYSADDSHSWHFVNSGTKQ